MVGLVKKSSIPKEQLLQQRQLPYIPTTTSKSDITDPPEVISLFHHHHPKVISRTPQKWYHGPPRSDITFSILWVGSEIGLPNIGYQFLCIRFFASHNLKVRKLWDAKNLIWKCFLFLKSIYAFRHFWFLFWLPNSPLFSGPKSQIRSWKSKQKGRREIPTWRFSKGKNKRQNLWIAWCELHQELKNALPLPLWSRSIRCA